MPNVWLAPSPQPVTRDDLVSGVEDGVLIDGRGSYSIDQQRYNFQFGGDAFWEIKGGKVGAMIADVAYQTHRSLLTSVTARGNVMPWRGYAAEATFSSPG